MAQSSQLKYTFDVDSGGWNNIIIDLPTGLTIQNRKLHRSCMEYTINGGYVFDSNQNAQVKLGVLPNTFPVRAAIRRGRNAWLEMHKELLTENPQLKPKWHDYKIKMITPGAAYWLTKEGNQPTIYRVPEDIWDTDLPHNVAGLTWSTYVTADRTVMPGQSGGYDDDADEFNAHVLGPNLSNTVGNLTSVGLLQSWIDSRPDLDPISERFDSTELDEFQDDPIAMLFNSGDTHDEIIEQFTNAVANNAAEEGDAFPPYHLQTPADEVLEVASASTTQTMPISYFTGFKAMLGQVFLRVKTTQRGSIDIIFDVNPRGESI